MKLEITVSISVGRSTLAYFSKAYVRESIEIVFKEKLVNLPPTYTIESIEAKEVNNG